jgi:hypothetical protein
MTPRYVSWHSARTETASPPAAGADSFGEAPPVEVRDARTLELEQELHGHQAPSTTSTSAPPGCS